MKMDDRQLVRAIEALETAADDGELAQQRVRALEYYRGENVFRAPEGRSQVVDRTVYDIAESVKGPILKLFLSGDEVVKFTPRGPEDIQAADQESAYINYVVAEKNNAFDIFGGWLHDALVQKNGYVIADWKPDEYESEKYKGLTIEEFQALVSAPDAMVEEVEEKADEYGNVSIDCKIKRTVQRGCVRIKNLPPESVLVDPSHTEVCLRYANFVSRREQMTISELREMGYDVEDDISDGGESKQDYELELRRQLSWREDVDGNEPDPSMRRVKVRECWIRTDYDGDGEAELRHVIVVGTTVLENEEADCIPVVAFSAKPLPHQHYGESFYDEAKEIQDVKTALLRGVLDNLYLANNGRYAMDAARVNQDDMLVSRPGGIVRVEGSPGDAILPLVHPSNPAPALSTLEYMDVVRETRTGVTRVGTGLDPNALNKTASGIAMLQGAQSQRIELIARHFAESVKELCLLVHGLTLKHSRQADLVMLRNKWVPVDPRQWSARKDMSISVGLGNGNRQEQQMFLMQWLTFAAQIGIPSGLVTQENFYTAAARFINTGGFRNAEEFVTNPKNQPPKPPQPDPQMVKAQMDAQVKQAELQAESQWKQLESQLKKYIADQDAAMKKYEADLQAQVQILLAQQSAQVQETTQTRQIEAEDRRAQPAVEAATAEKVSNESLTSATQAIMEGLSMMQQTQAAQMQAMQQLVESANRPKQVIRDQNGRVVGVAPAQ